MRRCFITQWQDAILGMATTGLDMDVPIGKVLDSLKNYTRIRKQVEQEAM